MKVFLRNLTIFSFILLLAACGSSNNDNDNDNDTKKDPVQPEETVLKDGDKQEVFDKVNTASSDVDFYDVIIQLDYEEKIGENKSVSRSILDGTIEESTLNLNLTSTSSSAGNTDKLHVYKLDGEIYEKKNDEPWVETIEQNGEYSNDSTFYSNLTTALDEVIDEIELVELDDTYEIRYTGSDIAIFNAFQKPFNLTLTGVDIEKDTEMNILAVIDKETLHMGDLFFETIAVKDADNIKITVNIEYENINNTSIEIPQEVIDEATVDEASVDVEESTGTALNQEDTDEILDEIFKKSNSVDIYDVDMELSLDQTQSGNTDASVIQLYGTVDETKLNADLTVIETSGINKNESHSYQLDDVVYIKSNDENWVKSEGSGEGFDENSTTYRNLSNSLESIRDRVKVFELGDEYEIRYTGSELEVFNAFEKPFSLSITGFDIEKDSELQLYTTVDKESIFVKNIYFGVFVEGRGIELNIVANVNYDNINDTMIEVPQEVIDEAN